MRSDAYDVGTLHSPYYLLPSALNNIFVRQTDRVTVVYTAHAHCTLLRRSVSVHLAFDRVGPSSCPSPREDVN